MEFIKPFYFDEKFCDLISDNKVFGNRGYRHLTSWFKEDSEEDEEGKSLILVDC